MMANTAIDMLEWQSLEPSQCTKLAGLELGDRQTRALSAQLTQAGILEIQELRTGLYLHASSFVGRVHLGDIQVTIRPKIEQMRLLHFLRYAYGLRELRLYRTANYDVAADAIPDLLIRQLAAEVEELLDRGLRRAYVSIHEELRSPRDRIDVQAIARRGGVVRDALPCTHHPRTDDSLLNRVLLAGIRAALRITADAGLRVTLHRLAAMMAESIATVRLDAALLHQGRRSINRLTTAYAPALILIELLLNARGISFELGEATIAVPGFLFDMNRLFQAVLSRFLRENLAGFTVRDEYRLKGMLAYNPDRNPWHRVAPTPRPDYAVMYGPKIVALLDAKYMDLWEREGIGRDVLYQLAIYALSQPAGAQSTILYPTAAKGAIDAQVDISEPVYGHARAHVVARPVQLDRLEPLLADSHTIAAVRERATYARWLAFGESSAG